MPPASKLIAVEFLRGAADGAKEVRSGEILLPSNHPLPSTLTKNGQKYTLTEVRIYLGPTRGSKAIYTPHTPHTP